MKGGWKEINKIRILRKNLHFTQERLAQLIGVTQQAVDKWEKNGAQPSSDKLPLLAKILECTIDDLFIRETG